MSRIAIGIMCLGLLASSAQSQGLGGAGTVQGTVKDPTGGVMQAAQVKISNPVTGFARIATTDAAGKYVFNNLPPSSSRGCGSGISPARTRSALP
jgi:hypothetical protein